MAIDNAPPIETDVLIVGGGPVGLCIAYQLARFSRCDPITGPPIKVHIVEHHPKPIQENFGRAVTFWSRSMEMLDQIGLADDILQQCVAVRSSAAYDPSGNEVFGRGWSFLEGISDTRFRFASVLRQKFVEDIIRKRLSEFGIEVHAPARFVGLEVDEKIEIGQHRVTATIADLTEENKEFKVKCKYLIGCDGSRTAVRGAAGIDSDGDRTEDKWVRVDGVLKSTNMPKPRSYGAIESPVYGNVLWIPLDHGATRIGFALNDERRALYPELTREVFIKEAQLSVAPFQIEYERVDWASVYSVGQRVAKTFWKNECIFLAGDACHTHSSGAGQGMNAGMHDAVNLGWKLALVLKGIAKKEILATYDLERRPNAEKLIRYDEDISVLVTGRLPKSWTGDPNTDPNVALGTILQEAKGFNTGLTIGYTPNDAVLRMETEVNGNAGDHTVLIPAPALPGYRAPEIKLILPALWEPVWLQQLTKNFARFYILTFVGASPAAKEDFSKFKGAVVNKLQTLPTTNGVETGKELNTTAKVQELPVDYLTILPDIVANPWFELGTDPLGKVYYDDKGESGKRYGIDSEKGAIFVVRPDGWIGARFDAVSEQTATKVDAYLRQLLKD